MSDLRTMQQQLAEAMLAQPMPHVASLCGDAMADDASRLAIYHHGYRIRLREALAVEFPGLRLLAGRRFVALLDDYVATHPSTHFNIRWHGKGLASFLATTPPWSEQPALAEMAQLDWAISTAFDAADHPAADPHDLARVPPDAWATMSLRILPNARLVRATGNIEAFRRAADHDDRRPGLRRRRRPQTLLVWRPALDVRYRSLAPDESAALQVAMQGGTFAQLCECMAELRRPEAALPRVASLLMQWLGEGLIGSVELAGVPPM